MTTIVLVEKDKKIRNHIVEKLKIFSDDIERILFCDSMLEASKVKAKGEIVYLINQGLQEYVEFSTPYGTLYDASNLEAIDEYVLYIHENKKSVEEVFDSIMSYSGMFDRLVLNDTKDHIVLPWSDIISIERVKRYSLIKTKDDKIYTTRQIFEELLAQLGPNFIQTHRSYIVNLSHVKEFKKRDFEMSTGELVSISRSYAKEVSESWSRYKEIHNLN